MCNIKVGRYEHPSVTQDYLGWIEPEDKSWIMYIRSDRTPEVYLNRDQETGAIEQK